MRVKLPGAVTFIYMLHAAVGFTVNLITACAACYSHPGKVCSHSKQSKLVPHLDERRVVFALKISLPEVKRGQTNGLKMAQNGLKMA